MPFLEPHAPVPVALCLGGLDPSGGAGLLRDALTLAAVGAYPMVVPTAETLQNGLACLQILPPSLDPVTCLEGLRPHLQGNWGVKLGLCALEITALEELVSRLEGFGPGPGPRIWDPVQAPTAGVRLHDASALRRMAETVLRHGHWVVVPNRPEAAAFGDHRADADPTELAKPFLEAGARAVWLKGGHGSGMEVEDFWIDDGACRSLGRHPRLPGDRRGTGCTVASAWLGFRLRGHDDLEAARLAGAWLREHWENAFTPGGAGRPTFAPVRA